MRAVIAFLCLILAITFAASPFFVEGFAGFDPTQFPIPQQDPPVQPAGYAFAIWGMIYVWLIVGMVWGAWKARDDDHWHEMRLPLCLSLAIGTFWLAVAVASPIWASVLIWAMLLSALAALFAAPHDDIAFAALPVGLYAGWLSAASFVSLGLLAAGYGWLSETNAALIFFIFAIGLAAIVQALLRRAPSYGVAVIWALVAVAVENWRDETSVAVLALAGATLMLVPTYAAWRKT